MTPSYRQYLDIPGAPAADLAVAAGLAGLLLALVAAAAWAARRASPGVRALLVPALVLAWFGLLELGLRLESRGRPARVVPDPALGWIQDEGADIDLQQRLGERPGVPGATLLFMGDSQLLEVRGPNPRRATYPARVGEILRRQGLSVRCVNAGVPGYSSWQALLLLRSRASEQRPALVVWAPGWNDPIPVSAPDREVLTDREGTHLLRRALYRSQGYLLLRALVLGGPGPDPDPATLRHLRVSPEEHGENLREAARLARRQGGRLAVLLQPTRTEMREVERRLAPYREQARRMAAEEGCFLVDAFSPVAALDRERQDGYFPEDEVHLSPAGHARLAEILARQVLRRGMLEGSAEGRSP